ncbi:MAG: hypothetical protein HUK22_01935 [Thermoguttaceae bacterium]|nr:hypothetical protein [Thermoguttaceae bacterium]
MKRRRLYRRARGGAGDFAGDEGGQDSFLDVVSNLVGVLIILVMVAGSQAGGALVADAALENAVEGAPDAETEARAEYVAAFNELSELRDDLEKTRNAAEEIGAQTSLVEQQANGAEEEYKELLTAGAALEGAINLAAKQRSDSEKDAFSLKGEIFEKEQKRDALVKENNALAVSRPAATTLENVPTPLARRAPDGSEAYFSLKGGKISHVPLEIFTERAQYAIKNYKGKLERKEFEEKIGPIENYSFHYLVRLDVKREPGGIRYTFSMQHAECIPETPDVGEPVDVALANRGSDFQYSLNKYPKDSSIITIFLYPDSFSYLRDVKKFLLAQGWEIAVRPLPQGYPITISPDGSATATY